MAVNLIEGLTDSYVAGFASNNVKMEDTSSYDLLRCRMRDKHTSGNVTYGNEYSMKSENNYAFYNLKDLQTSILTSYNNLISAAPNSGTFNISETWDEHAKKVVFHWNDLQIIGESTYSSDPIYIFKATNIYYSNWTATGSVWNPKKRPIGKTNIIRYAFNDQVIPFTLLSTRATYTPTFYGDDNTLGPQTFTFNNGYGCILYKLNPINDYSKITMSETKNLSEDEIVYIDKGCYPRKKVLYFLNESGAWDWYCFIDYEQTDRVTKEQYELVYNNYGDSDVAQNNIEKYTEMKLYGKPVNSNYYHIINDLYSSPVVLDENGSRVLVKEKKVTYITDDIIEPKITIKYKKDNIIKY